VSSTTTVGRKTVEAIPVALTLIAMGHKGIRDGGPPREPCFRPEDVVGMPIRRALVELAHEGFITEIEVARRAAARATPRMSNRVRLVVENGVVTSVAVG